jgi:hypothetical protein
MRPGGWRSDRPLRRRARERPRGGLCRFWLGGDCGRIAKRRLWPRQSRERVAKPVLAQRDVATGAFGHVSCDRHGRSAAAGDGALQHETATARNRDNALPVTAQPCHRSAGQVQGFGGCASCAFDCRERVADRVIGRQMDCDVQVLTAPAVIFRRAHGDEGHGVSARNASQRRPNPAVAFGRGQVQAMTLATFASRRERMPRDGHKGIQRNPSAFGRNCSAEPFFFQPLLSGFQQAQFPRLALFIGRAGAPVNAG